MMSMPVRAALALLLPALLFSVADAGGQPASRPAIPGYLSSRDWLGSSRLAGNPYISLSTLAEIEGGPVSVLTVGAGDVEAKPAIAILGSVSAALPAGTELSLRLAQRLAEAALQGGEGLALLQRVTFYIIPQPSPGSLRGFCSSPVWESSANARPTDDDHDGMVDEDGYEDLNGDGLITLMRVADPTGGYRTHPADPRVMIKADTSKNEQGGYALYPEGIDNDGDGQYNEDPPGGVDFNRNFPFRYPYCAAGAGPHQVSEPETRAVADFLIQHQNIAIVLCYSLEDNLLVPWRAGGDSGPGPHQGSILADDERYFAYMAEQYRKMLEPAGLSRYQPACGRGEGSFSEWAYFDYGRFSLACLPWWPVAPEKTEADPPPVQEGQPAPAPVEDVGDRGKAELQALAWMAANGQDGFVAWTPVEHPGFPGKLVEVGGFKPYVRFNPPSATLNELAGLHYGLLQQLAGALPTLALTEAKVEQLGGGVRRVTVKVANLGYLPTMSAMGEVSREPYPLQYTLQLPSGAELINGYPRGMVQRLAGNGGCTELAWLIRGPGWLTVGVASPAVTGTSAKINLETGKLEQAQ
jgi:hypothetical protein